MTAVEWLEEELKGVYESDYFNKLLKQAKKMEKQQIMEAWLTTKPITFNGWKTEFEEYYNEKYK